MMQFLKTSLSLSVCVWGQGLGMYMWVNSYPLLEKYVLLNA